MRRVAFLCAALAAGGAVCAAADLPGLQAAVDAVVARRDAAAREWVPAAGGGMRDGCLVLDLAGAVSGADLHVELLRRDGAWTDGRARAPRWNLAMHAADGARVTLADTAVGGTLSATLVPWSDRRNVDPSRGVPLTVAWTLALKPARGQASWRGEARLANPREAPLAEGPFTVEARWLDAGTTPAFSPPPAPPGSLGLLGDLVVLENRAAQAYQQVRALRLAHDTGLPYSIAADAVARCRVVRLPPAEDLAPPGGGDGPRPAAPSLDDLLEGAADLAPRRETARAQKRESVAEAAALAAATEHVSRLHEAVDRALATTSGTPAPSAVQRGDADCPDPEFGPWDGCALLPRSKEGVNLLPADIGAAGPQTWPAVAAWQVLGPFPLTLWPSETAVLPDVVFAPGVTLGVETEAFPGRHGMGAYKGDGISRWEAVRASPRTGLLTPPAWMKNHANNYMVSGMDFGAFYAVAEVESPAARDVWAAVQADDRTVLWVNDRLVWTSGPVDPKAMLCTWRLKLPLAAGRNRLLLRAENTKHPHNTGVRVCVRGAPRDAATARAHMAAREAAAATRDPVQPREVTGFRHDQSGVYPGPAPVAAWDLDRGINVLWHTPLKHNNGPVMAAGGRVFAWEDPCTLVCLKAEDGSVAWRNELDPIELGNPAVWTQVRDLRARVEAAAKDPAGAERGREATRDLERLYLKHAGYRPGEGAGGYTSPQMATPLSDGRRVWVKSVAHAIVCLDMDGRRLWAAPTYAHGGGMGHPVSSPLLVGGRVICQVPRYDGKRGGPAPTESAASREQAARQGAGGGEQVEVEEESDDGVADRRVGRRQVLMAWDAETGREQWTTVDYVLPHFGNRYDADGIATPCPLRLTDGVHTLDVILTNGGQVFRATDGALLMENAPYVSDCAATPVSDGRGTVYFMAGDYGGHSGHFGRAMAVRFVLRENDRIEAVVLWNRDFQEFCYGGFTLSDGILHAYHGYRQPGSAIGILDAAAGQHLGNFAGLSRHQPGEEYAPATIAGGRMFVVDTGRCSYNRFLAWKNPDRKPMLPANMTVLLPGRSPLVLARNDMEGVSMPVAVADGRVFVRNRGSVVCLARTGAEGERYEAEQVAATLRAQLPPAVPEGAAGEAEPLEPTMQAELPYEFAPEPLVAGESVVSWACATAVPAAERAATVRKLRFPDRCGGWVNAKAAVEGIRIELFSRRDEDTYPSRCMTEDFAYGRAFDLARVHSNNVGTVSLWSAIVRNDRDRTLRLDIDAPGARLWVGGLQVAPGQRVRLRHGNYLLAMETRLDAAPDGKAPASVRLRVRFWPSDDVTAERRVRAELIERLRPWLGEGK